MSTNIKTTSEEVIQSMRILNLGQIRKQLDLEKEKRPLRFLVIARFFEEAKGQP